MEPLAYRQEWNFATEHPSKRKPASEDEQRIHMKLYGECLHTLWSRHNYTDGMRLAVCDKCGAMEYLGRDKTEFEPADPIRSDREIRVMFQKRLPNYCYDDVVASKVFRDIEASGWICVIHSVADRFACSMAKGDERFVSTAHASRPGAIAEAAALVLIGKWPR